MTPSLPDPLDVLELPHLSVGLPPAPPHELDAYIDAAATCFVRQGILRTTIPDLARELGVSRTTVYRQVRSIDNVARMLLARELHRLLDGLPDLIRPGATAEPVSGLLVAIVRFARAHPVLSKVLADEPELIGPFLTSSLGELCDRVATIATPLLERAMDVGWIARQDARGLCEVVVRVVVTMVLSPPEPESRLESTLALLLVPG